MHCITYGGVWNQIISSLLFDVLHTSQSHNVVRLSPVCSLLATGPSEGAFGQDEKNSTTPFYANVEMDDGSVPMTTNPSYGQIELNGIHNKPIYANL